MNTTDIAQQLRLAADILETGHPWEYQANFSPVWSVSQGQCPLYCLSQKWPIRPALASPPYDAELHNPDKLTAEQVGVGYRLIIIGEDVFSRNAEIWNLGKWSRTINPSSYSKVATYRLPLFVPWPEQPKPFTLPTPPPGMKWHREDGWTADMLPPGTRPLVKGEVRRPGDQWKGAGELLVWRECSVYAEANDCGLKHYRTTRPLTFTHEGHQWTWHRAGEACPCDGERKVVGMTLHGGAQRIPTAARNYLWEDNDSNPIIGWRYADAPLPIQTLARDQVELASEMHEAATKRKEMTMSDQPTTPELNDPDIPSRCGGRRPSACSPIPAIESSVLNIGTAVNDCEWAKSKWIDGEWDDCVMWINNAINQLESARSKIQAHQKEENETSPSTGATE
jgi:hypothetical protein